MRHSPEAGYHDPHVRNLAWAIRSPPLLERATDGYRWLSTGAPAWYKPGLTRQLSKLDDDPSKLHAELEKEKDRRLGKYFEALLAFWLQETCHLELLARNLAVHADGRTIGEFDFIIRDKQRDRTLQLEVAVKFYLGFGSLDKTDAWRGPCLHDRFDKKLDRLLTHQTRLLHHPATLELLRGQGIRIDEIWVLIKGRLFYPLMARSPGPSVLDAEHPRGWWCERSVLPRQFPETDVRWQILRKTDWLARRRAPSAGRPLLSSDQLSDYLIAASPDSPVCIAGFREEEEIQRGFVVPDGWPGLQPQRTK